MSCVDNPSTIVELTLRCSNLAKRDLLSESDPIVVIYSVPNSSKVEDHHELGRTEAVKNNKNPTFKLPIQLQYFFEMDQKLEIVVFDIDEKNKKILRNSTECIGFLRTSLSSMVSSRGGKFNGKLSSIKGNTVTGMIHIECRDLRKKETLNIQFSARNLEKKDVLGKADPYLIIYRISKSGEKKMVAKTETIKNTYTPVWNPIQILLGRLVDLDRDPADQAFYVECMDWDALTDHDLIGTATLNIRDSLTSGFEVPLINPKKLKKSSYTNSGYLSIPQVTKVQETSFIDYLEAGFEISLGVAIDFTSSNGHPKDPNSLHYLNSSGAWNGYMKAIDSICGILAPYDLDQEFPVYGFGAALPGTKTVSHDFHVNLNPDNPLVKGVDGIRQAYLQCLQQVQLSGPTFFAPFLNGFCQLVQRFPKKKVYFVLLILTDGAVCDLPATKDALVIASKLPISVVIVGIGQADFSSMEELDADKYPLVNGEGQKAARDIVQFVPFHKFATPLNSPTGDKPGLGNSGAQLAAEVLREIPNQFMVYMQQNKIQL